MDDSGIKDVADLKRFLKGSSQIKLQGISRDEQYAWVSKSLDRFLYFKQRKKDKCVVKKYLMRMTGFSDAQMTRLIARKRDDGRISAKFAGRHNFPRIYSKQDIALLAEVDNLHDRLSGPATKGLFQRAYGNYGDRRFERLKGISVAHLYNLRGSKSYSRHSLTVAKTQAVRISIGLRKKPQSGGRPGFLRVDTVHQGDRDKAKGVYHINLVDEATQWEGVGAAEGISEAFLIPVLEMLLDVFPFNIQGFHSDNGTEYINERVAGLLNKLLIEQTKSRARRTNDNALVESKNGSIIRKHMGYAYIPNQYAEAINEFYRSHFNEYLNFHRPCGFATTTLDGKGKEKKVYKTWQTPYERLQSLKKWKRYLRRDITAKDLDAIAKRRSDNEQAQIMQGAKEKLFALLSRGCPASAVKRRPTEGRTQPTAPRGAAVLLGDKLSPTARSSPVGGRPASPRPSVGTRGLTATTYAPSPLLSTALNKEKEKQKKKITADDGDYLGLIS